MRDFVAKKFRFLKVEFFLLILCVSYSCKTDDGNDGTTAPLTLSDFFTKECVDGMDVTLKDYDRDKKRYDFKLDDIARCLNTPKGWIRQEYVPYFENTTSNVEEDFHYTVGYISEGKDVDVKQEFLAIKIFPSGYLTIQPSKIYSGSSSRLTSYRFTGPDYVQKIPATVYDFVSLFTDWKGYYGEINSSQAVEQRKIVLSPTQDSTTAFTFLCVAETSGIQTFVDGWKTEEEYLNSSLYNCPENKCEAGYSLVGVTDVIKYGMHEPLTNILDSRINDIFIYKNCSSAASAKYKKSVSIGSN